VSDLGQVTMSVLVACWCMPILGENQGNFEDFKSAPKNWGARQK
jgi:hypothetical protein